MTTFTTTDLSLASYLMARSFKLLEIGGARGSRRVFMFPAEAKGAAAEFYQGGEVGARAFANALRDLKTLIRER